MPQDSAKIKDLPEQSPVSQARAKLGVALEQLESIVLARMEEAANLAAKAQSAPATNNAEIEALEAKIEALETQNTALQETIAQAEKNTADESQEKWQNACHMLEEQLSSLKEQNSQLHSELHQKAAALKEQQAQNDSLKKANAAALKALDSSIAQVEALLKE